MIHFKNKIRCLFHILRSGNRLSYSLIDSYLKTRYLVFNPSLSIFAESFNPMLDLFLKEQGRTEWAYLTAANPGSKIISVVENQKRNQELRLELKAFPVFEGEGRGEDSFWNPEFSFLVLGISEKNALSLGKKFQQNAILVGKMDQRSKLKFLY